MKKNLASSERLFLQGVTMTRVFVTFLISFFSFPALSSESAPEAITKEEFEEWFSEFSNWGRWGDGDELGTLNLITPKVSAEAAALAKSGTSVSLSIELDRVKSNHNPHPFELSASIVRFGNLAIAADRFAVEYHGAAHTHIDALSHIIRNGQMYNGLPADVVDFKGTKKLGIHNMKDGIVSRGVLVDMAWFRGVDYLEAGVPIYVSDLEAWEAKTGVSIRPGDVLLVRTGRWERNRQVGASHLLEGAAGLHVSVGKWLKERDVAVLGSDGGNDVIPSGIDGEISPLHAFALVALGMPLMDNLNLDDLSVEALKQKRWEFLFVGAPLRAEGGTGSPINPLAVF